MLTWKEALHKERNLQEAFHRERNLLLKEEALHRERNLNRRTMKTGGNLQVNHQHNSFRPKEKQLSMLRQSLRRVSFSGPEKMNFSKTLW